MICLQTLIKFGDRVLKSVLTIKSWIIYVLNDLRFKTLMIINNWERDEPQRVSLVLEVVQEGFRPSLKDGTRDRRVCSMSEWMAKECLLPLEWMTSFHLQRVYLLWCMEKEVGSGWGAITEAFLRPDLAVG